MIDITKPIVRDIFLKEESKPSKLIILETTMHDGPTKFNTKGLSTELIKFNNILLNGGRLTCNYRNSYE